MKLFKILAIAAMAMVSSACAQAGVVVALSNLGPDGLDFSKVGSASQDQTSSNRSAVGFTTTNPFKVDSISAGMFGATSPSVVNSRFGIFSDNSGVPGTLITESAISEIGELGIYTFSFSGSSNTLLAAGSYWALPTLVGGGLSWYRTAGFEFPGTIPTDPNAPGNPSGLSYVSSKTTLNSGSSWNIDATRSFAIRGEVNPATVPEPALTSLLCLSGIALIRRRMKK